MTLQLLLLILVSVGMSALAQMLLKLGMTAPGVTTAIAGGGTVPIAVAIATSPQVIGGLSLYGLGAVLWLFVLTRADLSAAYPFVGLGFVLTMLIGAFVFHEQVGTMRIAGTLLILLGCVLVARSIP